MITCGVIFTHVHKHTHMFVRAIKYSEFSYNVFSVTLNNSVYLKIKICTDCKFWNFIRIEKSNNNKNKEKIT